MSYATVRDQLWVWGHLEGSHNGSYNIEGLSRMTPAESAYYLGIPNALFVRYRDLPRPPHDQHALALRPLDRVVWSIVGAGGRTDTDELATVLALAGRFPNIGGVIMDDFFRKGDDGGWRGVHTPSELRQMRVKLHAGRRTLPLWVVLYAHQLAPESAQGTISDHLAETDVVTFWSWQADDLVDLERDFAAAERLAVGRQMILGCYLYDYGDKRPMPVAALERQCKVGLEWLQSGRIAGMIFLGSCICDLELPAVEWARDWIAEVGDLPARN